MSVRESWSESGPSIWPLGADLMKRSIHREYRTRQYEQPHSRQRIVTGSSWRQQGTLVDRVTPVPSALVSHTESSPLLFQKLSPTHPQLLSIGLGHVFRTQTRRAKRVTDVNHSETFGPYTEPVWLQFRKHNNKGVQSVTLHASTELTDEHLNDADLTLFRLNAGEKAEAQITAHANSTYSVNFAQMPGPGPGAGTTDSDKDKDKPTQFPRLANGSCLGPCGGTPQLITDCPEGKVGECNGDTLECVDPERPGSD